MTGRPPSLTGRLIRQLTVVYAGALLVALFGYLSNAWYGDRARRDDERARFVRTLEGALVRQENGLLALQPDPALAALVAAAPGLRYVVVDAASGRVVLGSSGSLGGALRAGETNRQQPVPARVPAP